MPKDQEKRYIYAAQIVEKVAELIEEEITEEELLRGDNLTQFIHALSTIAPNLIYEGMTNNKVDNLAFNHIANRLVLQYSNITEKAKEVE